MHMFFLFKKVYISTKIAIRYRLHNEKANKPKRRKCSRTYRTVDRHASSRDTREYEQHQAKISASMLALFRLHRLQAHLSGSYLLTVVSSQPMVRR